MGHRMGDTQAWIRNNGKYIVEFYKKGLGSMQESSGVECTRAGIHVHEVLPKS